MKKATLLLLLLSFISTGIVFAQDDDLPPPTSKPKADDKRPDSDFVGFKPKKKVDLSKFIIEPNFNLSIGQGMVVLGLSPYVGYKVFEPKNGKGNAGNTGLFVGGGVTYFYSGFRNIEFRDATGNAYYANANWHTFGGGVFTQYNIWRGFFARLRFEVLHRRMDDFTSGGVYVQTYPGTNKYTVIIPKVEKTIPALLIGAGYNLLQSKNFFFPILVSYNVLHPFTTADQRAYSLYPRGLVVQLGFINVF
ncbi:MAG: hypothetical protein KIS94_07370 [Chitinophagales bacterium]|nr:hypothetical protein [Chitinophagales bacterium]